MTSKTPTSFGLANIAKQLIYGLPVMMGLLPRRVIIVLLIEPIKVFERIADATNFVKARNKEDKVYYYSIEIVPMKYIDKDEIV